MSDAEPLTVTIPASAFTAIREPDLDWRCRMLLPFLPISWPTGKPSGKGKVCRERYMLESQNEATIECVDRKMWVPTVDAVSQIHWKTRLQWPCCILNLPCRARGTTERARQSESSSFSVSVIELIMISVSGIRSAGCCSTL